MLNAISITLKKEDAENIKLLRENHIKVPSMVREFLAKQAAKYKPRLV
jgi:hypothetical protein